MSTPEYPPPELDLLMKDLETSGMTSPEAYLQD